ncbi:MAG: GNAT family N-acetyltransferase [Verrucomicrobiota bacterium]|nr:GNAT family N-acetyltransferase [Verrucomicrobiota bacterium]
MDEPLVTIRLAANADRRSLAELMKEFYAEEHLRYTPEVERAAAQLLDTPGLGVCGLIYADTTLAGYTVLCFGYSLEFHGRFGLLDELYVRPAFRRKGIGNLALEWAVAYCQREGIGALRLEVDRLNTLALSLYERAGFTSAGRDYLTRWIR